MKRILVCLDGSERSRMVLTAASTLAQQMGAKLHLFTAVPLPLSLRADLFSMSPFELPALLLENAKKALIELSQTVAPELIQGTSTEIGAAWDAIESAADALDADLIVIGSHGYGKLDVLLGTTAARVVNHADRSVLVVRPQPLSSPVPSR